IPDIVKAAQEKNRGAIIDMGKDIAQNYVDGYNNTINGAKLKPITPGLTKTGAAGTASTTASVITGGVPDKIIKDAAKQIQALKESELSLAEFRMSLSAKVAKEIADNDNMSFNDRQIALES